VDARTAEACKLMNRAVEAMRRRGMTANASRSKAFELIEKARIPQGKKERE